MSFEPVAIIGMSCRFPGANGLNAYWQLLKQGKTAISDIPENRWDIERYYDEVPMMPGRMYSQKGGFLRHIGQFDAAFFGISAKESQCMDPQQRILLESAWNALEDAAIAPHTLANTQTGVFVGISTYDYNRLISQGLSEPTAHVSTGCNLGIAANRISYALSLRGPSLAIDTACSSALVAIHHACRSLATQESNLCLVGGVNAILSREPNITFSQAQALSLNDCCAPFSSKANGYVRGEGCGVVVLKRLVDAQRDGDRIQAVIRGSAINHNGLTSGLTAPNGPAQQTVIRQALSVADIKPTQISYVETHAVGTAMGDAIEINALKAVLTEDRAAEKTCWIGTNKPNIGHLEAASGMANLIKVVLALRHQQIPPHPNLEELNPYIKIDKTPLEISTTLQPWLTESETRIAGVSSFGFGGANAHIVVEEASQESVAFNSGASNPDAHSQPERPLQLLTLSAKSEAALQALSQRYQVLLENTLEEKIADICFTANVGRTHFDYRLALVAESSSQFREQLQAFSQRQEVPGVFSEYLVSKQSPTLVFNFIDASSLTAVPSSELYKTQPTFRKALERCEAILRLYLDPSFLEILYPTQEAESLSFLSQHPYKQLTQFCWGFALSEVLRDWGIQPTVVTGQGAGTYIAACINGSLSLEICLEQLAKGLRLESEPSENGQTQQTDAVHLEVSPKHISDWSTLLQAVGRLYTQGVSVNWARFDQRYVRRKVALPSYPWQRQRYWFTDTQVSEPQATETPVLPQTVLPQTDSELEDQVISQPTANPATTQTSLQVSSNSSQARELIDWLRDYASTRINSRLIDERRCISPHIVLDFGDRGLFGLQVPSEYGGLGLNTRDALSLIEQLGAIDQTLTLLVGNHNALGIRPIMNWATDGVRQSLLPRLATGRELSAFALTEPGAGANPRALAAQARPMTDGKWSLTGTKIWSGSAAWAGAINVFVQQYNAQGHAIGISGFVVPQGSAGLRQGPEALTMGMRGMVQNTIFLEDVPVSAAQLLGEPGGGMSVAQDAMMHGRLGLAAGCLGGMKRCAQLMVRYSSRRTVASGRLLDNAITQVRLHDLTHAIAALETLVFTVADLIDQGLKVPEEAYIACKTTGPEFFWQAADHLVQLMGGRGYIETNIAPQILRDARVFRIFEGPTEALNMFLGSRVLHKGEELYQFFSQTLGVPTVAQQLQQAVKNIQTHLIDASDRSFQGRATQWAYACIGEISSLAILLATVKSANERASSAGLSRAYVWVEKQFEETLVQSLNLPAVIQIDFSAQALCNEIAGYQSSIGEVTQQAIGENHSLDELLQVSAPTTAPTTASSNPSDNSTEQQKDSPIAEKNDQLPYTAEMLQNWIENWLSQTLNIEQSIDHNVSFADYGIDSVMAVELIHDLEDWLQHTLDVTALWNFPTIKTLAEHLVSELSAQITDLKSAPSTSQLSSPKTLPVNFKDAQVAQEESIATSIERELGALEDLLGA